MEKINLYSDENTEEMRRASIVAYVGGLGNDIFNMTEGQIREYINNDISLMDEDAASFTLENLDDKLFGACS